MSDDGKSSRPRYKRSFKNYLIDPHFQLKYTGFLVAIALVLSAGLGVLLARSSQQISAQGQRTAQQSGEAVTQGQKTVERGKEVLSQSDKVNQVVSTTMESCYADSPELLEAFRNDALNDQKRLKEEQRKLEDDAAFLTTRAAEIQHGADEIKRRQSALLISLAVSLLLLVLGIGFAGIIFTHKIAGPIFKMKRLLARVGDGHLVLKERLRKGDELQHFFDVFEKMVDSLCEQQRGEIQHVDAIIEEMDAADPNSDALKKLRSLRAEMQARLDD